MLVVIDGTDESFENAEKALSEHRYPILAFPLLWPKEKKERAAKLADRAGVRMFWFDPQEIEWDAGTSEVVATYRTSIACFTIREVFRDDLIETVMQWEPAGIPEHLWDAKIWQEKQHLME